MPHPNAGWLGAFQGRELRKHCCIIFVMKYFLNLLTILLGIVVSALAFHAGGLGSIPWPGKSSKLTFSPSSHSPPVAITKPPH